MLKQSLTVLFLFVSMFNQSQNINVNQDKSYELFTATLTNSKDLKYQEILKAYDNYIKSHPNDIVVQVYKCKFIGSAYNDENDDYNLKYDETEACIDGLYSTYPKNPEVLLFKLENTYDGKEELIDSIASIYESNKSNWGDNQISNFYEICANYFYDDGYRSISYAEKAEKLNDSLDLSVLISKACLRLNQNERAKKSLFSSLHVDHDAWVLNEKGKLLVTLDEHVEALKMFDRVNAKDSTFSNNESLYKIFLEKENYEQARIYLLKDTLQSWNKALKIQKLSNHDMSYSNSQVALESLRRMQAESFYDDIFGVKRLRIFIKAPFKPWTFIEIFHVLMLLVLVLFLFLIPYLWVLPIFGAGKYFKFQKAKKIEKLPVDWSLKHFWLVSFLYLFCQLVVVLIYYYQDYMNYFFDIVPLYGDEEVIESSLVSANSTIVFFSILFISALFFLNKKRLKFTLGSTLGFRQIIGFSILFLVCNVIILKILGNLTDLSDAGNFFTSLSAKQEIKVILSEYGFVVTVLIAALMVPFYEEIIFRGIILSSTEKHIGFKWANVVQASLFASVHFSLSLFVFYFFFGIITGYAVKRTNGLLTGFVFHAVNNFVVVFTLYMVARSLPSF